MTGPRPTSIGYRFPVAVYVSLVALWALNGCAVTGFEQSMGAGRGGMPWTIRCLELQGPDRMHRANRVAQTLRRTPGIRSKDVFLEEEPDEITRIYYGTYLRRTNEKTGRRSTPRKMREDLAFIRQLGDESGNRFFGRAMPVLKPLPNVGNPKWKLSNVQATYSLQIAVFEPTDKFHDYKSAAADFCAYLRQRGYEAYYHHASASSMVTIGSFGPDAAYRKSDGLMYYSDEVLALQQDELLKHNLVNGGIIRVITSGGKVAVPSALVEIPRNGVTQPW